MDVFYGMDSFDPPLAHCVLTVGNFDGVHRAHQQLLLQAGLFAANTGGPVVVLTFEPHPLTVVAPEKAPERLSLPEEKLRCLAEAGADIVVVAHSEPSLLGLEPERFVSDILHRRFHPTHIVEGPSFGFGRARRGTPDLLRRLAVDFDFDVHIVEPVTVHIDNGEALLVSSSLIRRLLTEGKVRRASLCLGRPFALIGDVVVGQQRGRAMGFPTANVAATDQLVPGDGVYSGRAVVGGETYPAAISVGMTPTFGGVSRQVEAHLLDFDEDIYGQCMRVEFDRRLRSQQRFDSPDALIRQLHCDVQAVRDAAEPRSAANQAQAS